MAEGIGMSEARDKEIRVSVTPAEKAEITAAAQAEGVQTATFARIAALRMARAQG